MLYNETPDESVTGGAFYSDQEFESEFVDVLNAQCYRYLENKVQDQNRKKKQKKKKQSVQDVWS